MAKAKKSKKSEFKLPDLRNATPAFMMDELGDLRDQIKNLKKLEGIYKNAINAKAEDIEEPIVGERWEGKIEIVVQERFDSTAACAAEGEDWAKQYLKVIKFFQIRVKPVEE